MRIGIDLGGTKIEGIVLGPGGTALARRRVATPQNDYEGTLRAIVALVQELESSAGARGSIGIGHPGAVSKPSGLIKNANSTWLNGRPLEHDLGVLLGRPLRLANDANCFALSEATDGAGAGRDVVFGVIVGTGTGGGVVVHGRVLLGENAVAGEWGHNPLPWPEDDERPGPDCYCGRRGCIETFLSGPGFVRDHAKRTGAKLEPPEILAAAARGDPESRETFERYLDRMARALASVINLLDPNVIVLGGGMSHIDALYRLVPERWSAYVFSDRVDTPLERAIHGDASGVRGAAWLWPE